LDDAELAVHELLLDRAVAVQTDLLELFPGDVADHSFVLQVTRGHLGVEAVDDCSCLGVVLASLEGRQHCLEVEVLSSLLEHLSVSAVEVPG
jgi:hypothetical protein